MGFIGDKVKELNKLGNIEINEKEGYVFFSINPKMYSIDVVCAAAYVMIDRAFVILDGDPNKSIKVEIRKKEKHHKLKALMVSFNEELLNYATYKIQSEKNKKIREMLLQRILLTNNPNYFKPQIGGDESVNMQKNLNESEDVTQLKKKLRVMGSGKINKNEKK